MVGAGARGTTHARVWKMIDNARLVAVADIDEERAKEAAKKFDFDVWSTDFRKVVSRPDVNVVSVCTPAFYHPEVTVFAAQRGKHILCEKPIALTLDDADRMIEAADAHSVILTIGFQRRYTRYASTLARLIQRGEIGRPVMYRIMSAVEIRPKRAMHDMKRGNGGPIVDSCCHWFDLWRMVFNAEPTRVTARGLTLAKGREELKHIQELAPDTAALIVEYDSGDIGVITVSWGLPPGVAGQRGQDILGSGGVMFPGRDEITVVKEGGREKKIGGLMEDAAKKQIHHFVRTVAEEDEPKVTGEDGKIALRVSLAALESMETGKPVTLG